MLKGETIERKLKQSVIKFNFKFLLIFKKTTCVRYLTILLIKLIFLLFFFQLN
jgi:hypothetical protein